MAAKILFLQKQSSGKEKSGCFLNQSLYYDTEPHFREQFGFPWIILKHIMKFHESFFLPSITK